MSSEVDVQDPDAFGDARARVLRVSERLLDIAASVRQTTTQILSEVSEIVAERRTEYLKAKAQLLQARAELAACAMLNLLKKELSCESEKATVAAMSEAHDVASDLYQKAKKASLRMQVHIDDYLTLLMPLVTTSQTLGTEGARFLERRQDNAEDILAAPLPIGSLLGANHLARKRILDRHGDKRIAAAELSDAVGRWAKSQNYSFKDGPPTIWYSSEMDSFGEWDSKNNLVLSSKLHGAENDFRPYNDALAAVDAIREKRPLSFNQEHALETLWHELTHARSELGKSFLRYRHSLNNEGPWLTLIETSVEWYSRRTYASFVAGMEGEARHVAQLKEHGYAYKIATARFDALIKALRLPERRAEIIIEAMVLHVYVGEGEDNWENAAMELATTLTRAAESTADPETIKDALLKLDNDQFEMLLHSI